MLLDGALSLPQELLLEDIQQRQKLGWLKPESSPVPKFKIRVTEKAVNKKLKESIKDKKAKKVLKKKDEAKKREKDNPDGKI